MRNANLAFYYENFPLTNDPEVNQLITAINNHRAFTEVWLMICIHEEEAELLAMFPEHDRWQVDGNRFVYE